MGEGCSETLGDHFNYFSQIYSRTLVIVSSPLQSLDPLSQHNSAAARLGASTTRCQHDAMPARLGASTTRRQHDSAAARLGGSTTRRQHDSAAAQLSGSGGRWAKSSGTVFQNPRHRNRDWIMDCHVTSPAKPTLELAHYALWFFWFSVLVCARRYRDLWERRISVLSWLWPKAGQFTVLTRIAHNSLNPGVGFNDCFRTSDHPLYDIFAVVVLDIVCYLKRQGLAWKTMSVSVSLYPPHSEACFCCACHDQESNPYFHSCELMQYSVTEILHNPHEQWYIVIE